MLDKLTAWFFKVKTANSTENDDIVGVIGNKMDRAFSNWENDPLHPSIIGHLANDTVINLTTEFEEV
jgi:hypothetical protein